MTFKKRYLEEINPLWKGAALGAGAYMLGDHFNDDFSNWNNEMHLQADKGGTNYWNHLVQGAQNLVGKAHIDEPTPEEMQRHQELLNLHNNPETVAVPTGEKTTDLYGRTVNITKEVPVQHETSAHEPAPTTEKDTSFYTNRYHHEDNKDLSKLKAAVGVENNTSSTPNNNTGSSNSPQNTVVNNQPGQHERTINTQGQVTPAKSTNQINVEPKESSETKESEKGEVSGPFSSFGNFKSRHSEG
jgi:hypothetical protein